MIERTAIPVMFAWLGIAALGVASCGARRAASGPTSREAAGAAAAEAARSGGGDDAGEAFAQDGGGFSNAFGSDASVSTGAPLGDDYAHWARTAREPGDRAAVSSCM